MSAPVFLLEAGELASAEPGGEVVLDGEEGRHAVAVRRIRAGEVVELVDGAGRRVSGTVSEATGGRLRVTVTQRRDEPASAVRLVLVQALAKGGRDEQAVETATELGVDGVVPWQSQRCVARWPGEKAEKGRRRWQAVVRSATKQSRRAWLPEVSPLAVGDEILERVRAATAAGGGALVLHETAIRPLGEVELPAPAPRAPEVLVVVGPEGGLTEAEVTDLDRAGADVVRLGPHVLRTSTAGPVAVAALAQRLGRWG